MAGYMLEYFNVYSLFIYFEGQVITKAELANEPTRSRSRGPQVKGGHGRGPSSKSM